MTITVYSKPNCVQCTATYRALDKQGAQYTVVDLSQDEKALDYVRSLGHAQAPVVVAGDLNWAGFRPDMIKRVVSQAAVVNG
ncbi:glutaredoxin-like protein NrdH [Actinomycetaceae bacterium TAE3-ERU4]|nr:glutaredoxin-like protein NrdH [Actinomycetaceae bacterium TAE3-ERU4]